MRIAIILCSLVFASAAFIVQPVQAQGTATIDGTVCIRMDDMGEEDCFDRLPGATVAVAGGPGGLPVADEKATTDAEGRFAVDGLLPGDYTITITHAGFESHTRSVSISGDWSIIAALTGQEVDVSAQVLDSDGQPVADAWISMWGARSGFDGMTDADGRFSTRLTAGWYEVHVEAKAGALAGRYLVDGAGLVLQLGKLPGQDATLAGRITDQDGQPVEGAMVLLEQYEAKGANGSRNYQYTRNSTLTGADGRYEMGAYGGGAHVAIQKDGYAPINHWSELGSGKANAFDATMVRYPEKTAQVTGRVTDSDGTPLSDFTVSMQHPEYGLYTCSSGNASRHGGYDVAYPYRPGYEPPSCDIQIARDGTFSGMVTPGYAILSVHYDRWAACDETHHSDGSFERNCGPDYYTFTQTVTLEKDAARHFDIALKQRPGPDSAISGYVLDGDGNIVRGAHVSFNHQESYGWGSASTDKDGSFKVRVRSGVHHVNVWAEGFLPWEGTVEIAPGKETPFDIQLTAGQARYGGGCCFAYADEASVAAEMRSDGVSSASSGGQQGEFEDMRGGLGPYDAAARARLLQQDAPEKGSPSPLALVVVGLGLVALRRRLA